MSKKILLSGVKPTGRPHIGNYFGAMKQFVDLLNTGNYDCFFMIADYHALNFIQKGSDMRDNIIDLALDYIAIGLDPKKSVLFKQSDVTAHTELAWIFDTIITMPYLMRAHAFKDKVGEEFFKKNNIEKILNKPLDNEVAIQSENFRQMVDRVFGDINVGTFNYPVLMAADILLYNTDVVPVGQDQKQHIEYARDIAQRFNHLFCRGETYKFPPADALIYNSKVDLFKLPDPIIMKDVSVVPGTDGRKMSKSYGNTIPLFASDEDIRKAVMSIVTDSSGGVPTNVRAIHELIRDKSYLDQLYTEKAGKYKDLKDALVKDLQDFIRPMRERREKLAKNRSKVIKILEKGGKKANKAASQKIAEVRKKIGVTL